MTDGQTARRLTRLLSYNKHSGEFTWKETMGRVSIKGAAAGNSSGNGDVYIYVEGAHYLARRVAFLLENGRFPDGDIVNLDGDKTNLKLANLAEVSHGKLVAVLRGVQKNNTTGAKGVVWCKQTQKWRAQIMCKGKNMCLGRHSNFEDAVRARKAAERKYFGEMAA